MKRWLKRHFIPHEGNSYRPHLLRLKSMSQIAGIILFFELILFILPVINFSTIVDRLNLGAVLPGMLSTLTNIEREKNHLSNLVVSPTLTVAAQLKAEDMAKKSYFAHTSPEGLTPWYWFDKAGYKYSHAGENLAVNFTDSQDVTVAWMNSPGHRANIVRQSYQEVGTGIATGMYEGHETVFVAQLYGTPTTISKPIISSPQPTVVKEENTQVLGASEPTQPTSNVSDKILKEPKFWERVFSSPRQATNAMLYAVLAIIVIALFLNIVIKFEYQHPDLILNGAVVTALIFGLYFTNGYITKNNFQTSFIASDNAII